MKELLIPLGLQIVFFAVLLLEMILPSGGILAVFSIVLFGASWLLVLGSDIVGLPLVFLIADVILIPLCIVLGLKLMRRSPLSNRDELSSSSGFQVRADLSPDLVGQSGVTVSSLRPSGKIKIGNHVFDALSMGDFIESGTLVVVRTVSENKLCVDALPREIPPNIVDQV